VQTLDGGPLVYHSSATHIADFTPPYVFDIGPVAPTSPTFRITFSEPVQGFDNGSADLVFTTTNLSSAGANEIQSINSTTFTFFTYAYVANGATGGTYWIHANLASDITDLSGNPLATPNPTGMVQVAADRYQLWAIAHGLVAGSNFYSDADADDDTRSNGNEFLHDGEPLTPYDPVKRAIHIASIGGTNYFVLTMPAPDDMVYGNDGPEWVYGSYYGPTFGMYEDIWASSNIQQIVNGNVALQEDPSVPTPPGMPSLSPGYSYRHFRFSEPVTNFPAGFFMTDTVDD